MCSSYSVEDPKSFTEKVWFWINNIQLRVPDSVVLPVATHCDQCRSPEEVEKKRAHLDQKVREALEERRLVLTLQRKTLKERDPTQFSDQIIEMDRLMDRKLQVAFIQKRRTNSANRYYSRRSRIRSVKF